MKQFFGMSKINDRSGNVVGAKAVNQEQEIMIITTEGILIRIPVNGISMLGRITSGVKLIDMDEDISVASIAKVRESEKAKAEAEPTNA